MVFLEFATPIIHEGLQRLQEKSVTNILAVPGMLFAAGHAKNDIPSVLNTYQKNITYLFNMVENLRLIPA